MAQRSSEGFVRSGARSGEERTSEQKSREKRVGGVRASGRASEQESGV